MSRGLDGAELLGREGGRLDAPAPDSQVMGASVRIMEGRNVAQNSDDPDGAIFRSQRVLPYQPQAVFEAFARPELLARWWGPAGFTNTFEVFEFRPGGRWTFVMHGPDGSHHPNESTFLELHEPSKLVIQHLSPPRFVLTVTLAPHEAGTVISWAQAFEDSAVAVRIRHIVEPANEQNLDRLLAVLAGGQP